MPLLSQWIKKTMENDTFSIVFLVEPREIEAYTRPGDDFPAFFKENRGFCPFFFIFLCFLDRHF